MPITVNSYNLSPPDHYHVDYVELINPFIKAAAEDHTDADCLIVTVMSHGESTLLHSADSPYPADMLWTPFTADQCTTLAGKPKLFFIQVHNNPILCIILINQSVRLLPGCGSYYLIAIRIEMYSNNNIYTIITGIMLIV